MAGNTYGVLFKLSTFGESHGKAVGGIIDGCPAGLIVDIEFVQTQLNRRRPGQSSIVTARNEADEVQFLSGLFEGKTTGAPIAFMVQNKDYQSADYAAIKNVYRPSHADYTYDQKYGIRDYRGSGRASARETLSRVVAGAIAQLYLKQFGIDFKAYVSQVGSVKLEQPYSELNLDLIESNLLRCPHTETAKQMEELIAETKLKGDTLGGQISAIITGVPAGLGEPVFDKLHAELGKAMLSINAVKGFEIGSGFKGVEMLGSAHNDQFEVDAQHQVSFKTNHSGGVQGGISNGDSIHFNVAFKPVSTIMQKQQTIDDSNKAVELTMQGRHDVCVVPRAVPIVEAMAALVIMDFYLRQKALV